MKQISLILTCSYGVGTRVSRLRKSNVIREGEKVSSLLQLHKDPNQSKIFAEKTQHAESCMSTAQFIDSSVA